MTVPFTGILPPAVPVVAVTLVSLIPLGYQLSANLKAPRDERELADFAQHTVSSLIIFAVLVDAVLLITLPGG
jgi:hypothetical protein